MAVRRARACALLLATVLLGLASPAFPCGPFFPQAVFTFTRHPDLPLENFLRGQLGIVLPTYSRSHLYLSYRYLAGKPFSPEQLAALEGVWIRRRPSDVSGALQKAPKPPNWIKLWVEARKKIPGLDTSAPAPLGVHNPLGAYRSERIGTTYIGYYNCLSDAFRTAVHTLEERVGRFGVDSAAVNSWVQAQDRVFANCSGGGNGLEKQQFLPLNASAEDSPLIRADRAYQMGAAHFYAGNFEIAGKVFEEIAHDPDSPWSWLAPLLVARSLIRQATVYTEPGKPDRAFLVQAETQLQKVLADNSLRRTHPSARRLLSYVQLRLRPNQRICQLREALLEGTSPGPLRQDLTDYLALLAKWPAGGGRGNRMPLAELRAEDELADWMLTFQRQTPSARDGFAAVASCSHFQGAGRRPQARGALGGGGNNSPEFVRFSHHCLPQGTSVGRFWRSRAGADSAGADAGERRVAAPLLHQPGPRAANEAGPEPGRVAWKRTARSYSSWLESLRARDCRTANRQKRPATAPAAALAVRCRRCSGLNRTNATAAFAAGDWQQKPPSEFAPGGGAGNLGPLRLARSREGVPGGRADPRATCAGVERRPVEVRIRPKQPVTPLRCCVHYPAISGRAPLCGRRPRPENSPRSH